MYYLTLRQGRTEDQWYIRATFESGEIFETKIWYETEKAQRLLAREKNNKYTNGEALWHYREHQYYKLLES